MMRDRSSAAKHLVERELVTASAVKAWEDANRHFAKVSCAMCKPLVIETARFTALATYEAMLDAVITERDALIMLEAMHNGRPRRSGPKR